MIETTTGRLFGATDVRLSAQSVYSIEAYRLATGGDCAAMSRTELANHMIGWAFLNIPEPDLERARHALGRCAP